MENKKLSFAVDASQIDIKPLLKKEFLELTMRAISTANPNRNNSWFTRESLVASIDTFKNKPILGYFENGDFVSHNGQWKEDPETNIDYWDTLGVKGERPLGLIRSEDEVKVIDDEESGLSWAVLTCALWTQYNYKQVKRLLKDAKKAKEQGGPTKNISVEVDITDYEYLENGVMKINAFNLVGITILGSRNGVKVEPGIEDAELSVVDIMGTDLYEKQMQSLRLAYEKLDGSDNNNKEDFSVMEKENLEKTELTEGADTPKEGEITPTATSEDGSQHFENHDENGSDTANTGDAEENNQEPIHENHEENHDEDDDDHEDDVCPKCGKNPCECESKREHEEHQDTIYDLTWLLKEISGVGGSMECTLNYYKGCAEFIEGSDYIIPVLDRIYKQTVANEKELIGLLAKVAEGLTEEEKKEVLELDEHCDCKEEYAAYNELLGKFEAVSKELEDVKAAKETLEGKFAEIEKAEQHVQFMKEAEALISSAKLDDENVALFTKDCDEGKYASIDELKIQIGLKLFEIQQNAKVTTEEEKPAEEKPASFTAPVETPNTQKFIDENKGPAKSKWDTLNEYIKK